MQLASLSLGNQITDINIFSFRIVNSLAYFKSVFHIKIKSDLQFKNTLAGVF